MRDALELLKGVFRCFFRDRDSDGALAALTDDVRIFGVSSHGDIRSKGEARAFMENSIRLNPSRYSPLFFDETLTKLGPDTSVCSARVSAITGDKELSFLATAASRLDNGECRLCQIHISDETSAPVKDSEMSDELLNSLFSGGMLLCYVDDGFPVYYINRNLWSYLGYDSEASYLRAIGGLSANAIAEEQREAVCRQIMDGLCENGRYTVEYKMIMHNGTEVWIQEAGMRIAPHNGREAISCIIYDISEKKAQQAQLLNLIHTVPCGICLYRWDGSDLYPLIANKQFSEMLGEDALRYLENVSHLNYAHVHPDDLQNLRRESYLGLTKTGKVDVTYRSLNYKTNKYIWVRMRGTSLPQTDGTNYVYVSYYDVTDEHLAEQRLLENERMLEFAAEYAGLWYWRYDAANNRAIMDKKRTEKYGLPDIIEDYPQSWLHSGFVHPDYVQTYIDAIDKIRNGETEVTFEARAVILDNATHWVRFRFTNLFGEGGKVITTICTAMVIDTEKELWAKFELEKNRASLGVEDLLVHAVFNLTTGETIEYDYADGTPVPECSRDALAWNAANADSLLIDDEERRLYAELNDVNNLLRRFANGETEFRLDYRRILRCGKVRWVRCVMHMVRDPRSAELLLFQYWYDIEDEKMIELTHYSLANYNYDFIARIDGESGEYVITAREGEMGDMQQLRGDDSDSALISIAKANVVPDDLEMAIRNITIAGMKQNLAENDRFQFTCREEQPDGSTHFKQITEYYIDRQRGIFIMTREDVTKIVHAEAEKNAMLAAALDAANLASQAKSQFLSRVSHELRTPLNAIIGFLELSKGEDAQTVEAYLANADTAAKQLLYIINDVLDMSAIESGKLKLASSAFDFRHIIHAVTNIFVIQCKNKGLAYDTKILGPIDEWLVGDQLRVNQILMNLLGNAVKFTSSGTVCLTISQHDAGDNKVFVRFEVSDTGCGMSREMMARLFKPFEQESANTALRYGGSGLGLSIVNSLVKMMGGYIRAESKAGEGTTFTVDLPFVKSEAKRNPDLPKVAADLRVLAIDDEEQERRYLSIVLDRIGVRYTCAADGAEAFAAIEKAREEDDQYNICLIDWKIPDMNGIEITKRIREKYGTDVVVIVISAYEHYQADDNAIQAGANMFISKPLFQSTLFDLFMTLSGGNVAKKSMMTSVHNSQILAGKRVLLAEDNAMNRLVAVGLIKKYGVECDCAEDGNEAVEKFLNSEEGRYDAILMDIQMPNMDGFEATKIIRASSHPDARSVQIIALTANAFNEDIARTLSCGMDSHVAKPIEPDVLCAALSKAFSASEANRKLSRNK